MAALVQRYSTLLHNTRAAAEATDRMTYDTERDRQEARERHETRMAELESKIEAIKSRVKDSDACVICYDEPEAKTLTRCCQNLYCLKCISTWLSSRASCPMCKVSLRQDDLFVIQAEGTAAADDDTMGGASTTAVAPDQVSERNDKLANVRMLLRQLPEDARVLVFSGFEATFDRVGGVLAEEGIHREILSGNGPQIQATLGRYKSGSTKVLLMNSRFYGAGLNLPETTHIIMLHKLGSEAEA